MDSFPEDAPYDVLTLSYDDDKPYEKQLAEASPIAKVPIETVSAFGGLAGRISKNRVYLPPINNLRTERSKRKRDSDDDESALPSETDSRTFSDSSSRKNALLLKGTPISHLPTARLFAYANHFELLPVAIEWVDDISCVLVFDSASSCNNAQQTLAKLPFAGQEDFAEIPDEEGFLSARPIPVSLWPPEDRIGRTLGMAEGLKGEIRMRIARIDDVKKRGARNQSEFYRKHGMGAGKDSSALLVPSRGEDGIRKRRRVDEDDMDDEAKRAELDAQLDAFLARDDEDETGSDGAASRDIKPISPSPPPSRMRADILEERQPKKVAATWSRKRKRVSNGEDHSDGKHESDDDGDPAVGVSKMRSDYINGGGKPTSRGKSLLERTSLLRAHPDDVLDAGRIRLSGEKEWDRDRGDDHGDGEDRPRRRGRKRRGRSGAESRKTAERPKRTQEELDAELEAFLNQRG